MKRAEPEALSEVQRILTDETNSCSPALFPVNPVVATNPGLYSWWADETARHLIGEVLRCDIPPLIYAGQSGATKWPSGKRSSATLDSRIRGNHINGNAFSSTFRLTVSAILMEPLKLRVAKPYRLHPRDREQVSNWIREHLKVAIASYADRDSLRDLEEQLLESLDPPLNLQGMQLTPTRSRLSDLRKRISNG